MKSCGRTGDRGVIARLAFIKRTILSSKRPVNARMLADRWGCTSKTILRDIELLRDRLGHQLEFNAATNSWIYLSVPQPVL